MVAVTLEKKKKKGKTFVIITANFFLEKYYGEWKPF